MIRVLIVDDKEENRYYLQALLTGCGCTVETARHGAEALTLARQHPPHLIVSDLLMPVMDGYTLLRHWKLDPNLQRIPFIVYTATYTEAEDESLALNLGADAFILKPAEPESFLTKIREVHGRVSAGLPPPPRPDSPDETTLLRVYSQSLIRKLEEKTLQLQETNRRLQSDITERRRVELSLRASEASLATAWQIARMGSWEVDAVLGTITWSPATHRIFETDPATFQPTWKAILELIHPEDRAGVDTALRQSMPRTEPREMQHRLLLPDGAIKYVIARWQVFHSESGQPLRVIGTCRDVTERLLAERELQDKTALLHAVADSTPDAVFVKDLKGRYLLFNEAAARFVGRPVEEVLGRDDTDLFSPEDARLIMESDREVMLSGQPSTSEEVLTSAGATRTYLATKAPYRDRHGKVIGITGISRDITGRKEAEDKIREQATLLDKAQDAILVRSLDHHILYWNRSAEQLYGWSAEEVIGKRIQELLYRDPDAFLAATARTMETGEWVGELEQYTREGKLVNIEARWTLVRDDQGRPKSILAINTNITERRKIEQQFLRAQRMESIGTLAGGIAHDLNNVLAPIMMSIGMLRLKEQDPDRLSMLNTIQTSAQRGADMVRQVLSFARGVEGRRMEVQPGHLLREIETIVNETFLKSITVHCEYPDDLWAVQGDPTQLHQVLLNLCVNARDAMPGGGTLMLSARNTMLDENYAAMNIEAKPGPWIILCVEDTGTGMPPQVLERIFDPFFTTKEPGQGTGLGLSTSMAIIKSHGGFLRVTSAPHAGTTFCVHLPALPHSGELALPAAETELPRGSGELILVIDDEAAVREITRQTLEIFGYRVLLACDGAEAAGLYAAQKHEIAAVITDMMMPIMDGPATIQVLLRINPDVRIIAASGLDASGFPANPQPVPIRHFLPKPYTAGTLLRLLQDVLKN